MNENPSSCIPESSDELNLEGNVKDVTNALLAVIQLQIDQALDGAVDVVSDVTLKKVVVGLPEDIKNACLDYVLNKVKALPNNQDSLIEQENLLMLATLFGSVPTSLVETFLKLKLSSLWDDDEGIDANIVLLDLKTAGLIDQVTFQQHITRIEREDIVEVASTDAVEEA